MDKSKNTQNSFSRFSMNNILFKSPQKGIAEVEVLYTLPQLVLNLQSMFHFGWQMSSCSKTGGLCCDLFDGLNQSWAANRGGSSLFFMARAERASGSKNFASSLLEPKIVPFKPNLRHLAWPFTPNEMKILRYHEVFSGSQCQGVPAQLLVLTAWKNLMVS